MISSVIKPVFLSFSGYPYKEIAVMTGRRSHSVGHYVKAYQQNVLNGLKRSTPPGRAFRLTEEQRKILLEQSRVRPPDEVSYPSCFNWILFFNSPPDYPAGVGRTLDRKESLRAASFAWTELHPRNLHHEKRRTLKSSGTLSKEPFPL